MGVGRLAVECDIEDMLNKTDLGKAQGSISVKVYIHSAEEEQFIHPVGRNANIYQVN